LELSTVKVFAEREARVKKQRQASKKDFIFFNYFNEWLRKILSYKYSKGIINKTKFG
jgi:hypothetical protein